MSLSIKKWYFENIPKIFWKEQDEPFNIKFYKATFYIDMCMLENTPNFVWISWTWPGGSNRNPCRRVRLKAERRETSDLCLPSHVFDSLLKHMSCMELAN